MLFDSKIISNAFFFIISPLRRKGLLGGNEYEKILEETGNAILKREQWLKLYSCSKDRGGV